jgi:hypothetical protein
MVTDNRQLVSFELTYTPTPVPANGSLKLVVEL